MLLQKTVNNVFVQLNGTLQHLTDLEFITPCRNLSNNTIGQHVRHIIELFQCLEQGYECGVVNYEKRKRDTAIETDRNLAISILTQIGRGLNRPDKEMKLEAAYYDEADASIAIDTNYIREVAYNLEHTIHHMALIRVGINEVSSVNLPDDFGVASSTVKHRQQCAQ